MKPNLLIIMTDQERFDTAITSEICKTPNLDKLRKEGVSFNNVFPPMAHCCPSRASFMSGLYPTQHGIFNNVCNTPSLNGKLYDGVKLFSENLKESGYDLYYTGKWHVSATENPKDRGWNELTVTAKKDAVMGFKIEDWQKWSYCDRDTSPRKRGVIKKDGWSDFKLYGTQEKNETGEEVIHGYEGHRDYRHIREAKTQLTSLKNSEAPWCLYVGLGGPHDPFVIPEKYASMYNAKDISLPPNYNDEMKNKPEYYKRMQEQWTQLSEEEVKESIAHYYGYVTMLDDMLGEIMESLDENSFAENTTIIFTSDHGEFLSSHGLYLKGIAPYDEGYKVPLVISGESVSSKGQSVDELISIMDLAPTILEITNSKPLNKCAGKSLVPFLKGNPPSPFRDALYLINNGVEVYFSQRTVRTKEFKFVYNAVSIDELYDLKNDPYEMNNVASNEKYKDVLREMYKKMWSLAYEAEDSYLTCSYPTASTATYGPLITSE